MAKVAVTGAKGLIGSAVAAGLVARGHSVLALGRGAGNAVTLDLTERQLPALPPIDALIHCAGVTDEEVKADRDAAMVRAVSGTERLIAAAAAAGARRMVYVSSAHVYGALSGHIDETMPANPLSDYALAHYLAEQIFRRHAAATRILRPCAVFGPLAELQRFRRWSLIPFSFPRAIAESGVIRILGTGRDRRNFVGTDVVAALAVDFIEMQINGVTLLNPVGTADLTVAEFAELCARLGGDLLGRSCRVEIAGKGDTAAPPLEYRSVMGGQRNGRSLETHIVELVRQCSQLGATA
ncbi:NAD-dependent epimerase/dehydratase family protein [Dongia sedimenti]|uniref:NAD(P)-dependent oxidoreductase n=1 Tax=Dongia sedimenti TaxID=3064282 RepID=A0ABU0YIX5_9PROT|nr:NAD(P)-dependent oxidoreductase [Rhodospirillaceae bacterium R-7]